MKKTVFFSTAFVLFFILQACKKEKTPTNPFDAVNTTTTTPTASTTNTTEFVNIYKNIFATKCNNPGCHDGHFEPDFRSIESAYSTLVYQPAIKHTLNGGFHFRVIPFNTDSSWLHYRVTTTDNQIGRMPLYANPLSSAEIETIRSWINNGAKDMFGNPARQPNSEPTVQWFVALDPAFTTRVDTNRVNKNDYSTPFIIPTSMSTVNLYVITQDDHTSIAQLKNNKIKFSLAQDNFATPLSTINGTFFNVSGFSAWVFPINTSSLPHNTTIYFRYYTNDGDRTIDTEFPYNEMYFWYKGYFSFKIQ